MSEPNTTSRSGPAGRKRVVKNKYKDGLPDDLRIEGLVENRGLWRLAAEIPPAELGAGRKLNEIFYLLFPGLAAIEGSFRKAESELRSERYRRTFFELVVAAHRKYRPQEPPMDVDALMQKSPMTAQNFFDARRSWLAKYLPRLEQVLEESAAEIAEEVGYADPTAEGSENNLVRERMLQVDGKVVREVNSRYRLLTSEERATLNKGKPKKKHATKSSHVMDRRTGEIVPAVAMEGETLYWTGGGLKIGNKIIAGAIRDDSPNASLVLFLRRQLTNSEASEMVDGAIACKRRLPGLLGTLGDTALRGTHLARLGRAGLVGVARSRLPAAREMTASRRRVPSR